MWRKKRLKLGLKSEYFDGIKSMVDGYGGEIRYYFGNVFFINGFEF